MRPLRPLAATLSALALVLAATAAQATDLTKRSVCVFDIVGTHGDLFNAMKDFRIEAMKWGVDLELRPYTNEKIAAEDYKAGQCDAAVMTGLRARTFLPYAGTIDSVGSVPDVNHMRLLMQALADPKSAPKLRNGPFEVAGIAPLGAAYIFTRDKAVNSLTKASGKRVAVLDYDPSQARMVAQVGASPVPSDITNFAGKFNNGSVDIIGAPLAAYKPLELWKGLEPNGGIINYPFVMLSMQFLIRHEKFAGTPDFSQKSREYFYANFDRILSALDKAAQEVPQKYFVEIPATDKVKYEALMRDARVQLRNEGYYNGDMLTLLRKVRCKVDSARGECTDKLE
ncbi:MAG: putative solute-binding protein [Pseudomonadota bacterium]